MGLLKTQRKHNAMWVIINRLTKSTNFLPICETVSLEKLEKYYVVEIVKRQCRLTPIEILVSLLNFRRLFSKPQVRGQISSLRFILKPMDNRKGRFRSQRICLQHAFWTFEPIGMLFCHQLSSPTKIASKLAQAWLYMKFCMVDTVGLSCAGSKLKRHH